MGRCFWFLGRVLGVASVHYYELEVAILLAAFRDSLMVQAQCSRLNSAHAGANHLRLALEVCVVQVVEPGVLLLVEALVLGEYHL